MRPFIALVLGLATFDIEALAQVASEEDDSAGVICVGGHRWQPTPEDSLKIESFPVPESFRLRFESSGTCVRWGIRLDDGIVDWHLRFGSAQSVSNALGYIKDNSKDVPSPATYLPLLRRSVAAALPDLKRAAALKQPPGLSYSVRYRFMEQSKPVARFRELLRARDDHLFLARNYLRAAEEYTDPALLAKADSYISSLDATAAFLAPMRDSPSVRGLFDLDQFQIDDVRARAALLRARMSGSDADLAQADKILNSLERPMDKALADYAYSGGDEFCDISNGTDNKQAVEAACRDDDDIDERLTNYAINRAQYEAILFAIDGKQLENYYSSWTFLAERLLKFEDLHNRGRCCGRSADEDRQRLLMTRADLGAHSISKAHDAAIAPTEGTVPVGSWYDTLSLLLQAERFAPPFSAPARFTRIARQWLSVWRARPVELVDGAAGFEPVRDAEQRRAAGYFTAVLSDLADRTKDAAPR